MAHGTDHEIEIKLRVSDQRAADRRLRELGARSGPRVHEANVLFDTPNVTLMGRGMLLRVRVEGPAGRGRVSKRATGRRRTLHAWIFPRGGRQPALVTWKGPPATAAGEQGRRTPLRGGYKVRREVEFEVTDSRAIQEVLAALGYVPSFYYEKVRTTYHLPRAHGVTVTVDETPLGVFLELEGRPGGIDRVRQALGYQPADSILLSYGALYVEQCRARGVVPRDMVFGE